MPPDWQAGLDRDIAATIEHCLDAVQRATGSAAGLSLRSGLAGVGGEGPRAFAEAPVWADGARVGAVTLSGAVGRTWSDDDLASLADSAQAIGTNLALQTARRDAAKAQRLVAAHSHAHDLIAQAAPLAEVLDFVTRSIEAHDPSLLATVVLLDAASGTLHPGAGPSLPPDYLAAIDGVVIGPNVGTCGSAAWSGQLTITEDIATDPRWAPVKDFAVGKNLRHCWSMPIVAAAGDVLGTLAFYGSNPRRPSPEHISLQQDWARVVSIAIEREQATQRLVYDARHDGLTGLPNRNAILEELNDTITQAGSGRGAATLFVDLDGLKILNDTLGHDRADDLLREVGCRLVDASPAGTFVGRLGGDEFVVVAREIDTQEDAERLALRLLEATSQPLPATDVRMVTASIGITLIGEQSLDAREILRRADAAMYEAKRAGGDRCVFFEAPHRPSRARHFTLKRDLRGAELRGELRLEFQPIVELPSTEVIGVEALLRWDHPTLGTIAPSEFVPIAEDTNLIVPIGAWVLRESCDAVSRLRQELGRPLELSVNVSARQLTHSGFALSVRQVLGHAQLPATSLCLEITETAFILPSVQITKTLEQLGALGVRIVLDDFGTGFSSLSWLKQTTLAGIKVDRAFVSGVTAPGADRTIVAAVTAMASGLGCTVTAEGVETRAQLQTLVGLGCQRAQGFVLSHPLPAGELPAALKAMQVAGDGRPRGGYGDRLAT